MLSNSASSPLVFFGLFLRGAGLLVVGGSKKSNSQFKPCINLPLGRCVGAGLGLDFGLGALVAGFSSNNPACLTLSPRSFGVVGPMPCSFKIAAKSASSVFPYVEDNGEGVDSPSKLYCFNISSNEGVVRLVALSTLVIGSWS